MSATDNDIVLRVKSFAQRRWRWIVAATIAVALLWLLVVRPFTPKFTVVNAGGGKIYRINQRTGESWLLHGTTEIPINQLTPEQELVRQQSLIEADAATKKRELETSAATKKIELETAARIREAETEQTRLQQEFARQEYARAQAQKAGEQQRMQQQQARLQQERDQKLAADKKVRAIALAQGSYDLCRVLPNPEDPQHTISYSHSYNNRKVIIDLLDLEKDPNLQIEGWAAEKVADDVYLVSYTYTTGTGQVESGYYFEVNVNTEIVQNIFRNTERFNKYQQYGINPIPVPPLLAD